MSFTFHQNRKYLGLLLLALTACDSDDPVNGGDGGVSAEAGAPTSDDGSDTVTNPADTSQVGTDGTETHDAAVVVPTADGGSIGVDGGPLWDGAVPLPEGDGGVIEGDSGVVEGDGGSPVLFSDDFNGETLTNDNQYSLGYASFALWDVVDGSVDLIVLADDFIASPGGYGPNQPASGITVDLDGNNMQLGVLETKQEFTFEAGITYEVRYSLGSPLAKSNSALVEIPGLLSKEESQDGPTPFTRYSETFTPESTTTAKLRISALGTSDNEGLFLDNVSIVRLP